MMASERTIMVLSLAMVLLISACSGRKGSPLQVVDKVDIPSYMGVWYEIARYPNSFQKGCSDSRATYTLLENGEVEVINECEKPDGHSLAKGRAWIVDKASSAKLKVSFFWPFKGDYWIIDLGDEYEYSVVSAPSRKYLWILSRTPTLPPEKMEKIEASVAAKGFDLSLLEYNNK